MKKDYYHHYCILRKDLGLGDLCAQLLHAAAESNPKDLHCFAVALYAIDEKHLEALEERLIDADIPHVAIRESDMNNELTAIGINPQDRSKNKRLRQIVAGLPLIKNQE